MSGLEKLNFIIATYGRLFVALFRIRLWPPFFIYFLVMLLQVFLISSMFSPLFSGWVIPLAVWLTSNQVTHYPMHLALTPYVFQMFNLLPSLLLESVLTASAVVLFAAYFRRQASGFGEAFRASKRVYFRVVIIWLVTVVLTYLLFKALPALFHDVVAGSPRREIALSIGMQGMYVLLMCLFIYAIPYVMLKNRTAWSSLGGSIGLFFKNFFSTYIILGIPQFLLLALILPLSRTGTMVTKFNPDVILWLTYALAAALTLASFLTIGSVVRFFLQVSED